MSQLYVDNIRNRTGGPIGIPTGAVVTGVITATTANVTGNMTVGGVLTYEDVTNIDSLGSPDGDVFATGVCTATSFVGSGANLTGVISGVELESEGNSVGTAITNINFVGFNSVTAPAAGLSTVTGWEVFDTWLYGGG